MKKKSSPAMMSQSTEKSGPAFSFEFFNDPVLQRIFYAVVPFLVFFVIIFSAILFSDRQFSFRDCHLFYYPLFEQIQRELNQGNLPFWNPCDNLGEPLLAVPTSSVFYPLKLIFFLTIPFPGSFGVLYKIYILIHYPLAFWGVYRLARFWNRSIAGASLAAIAFTFSCLFFFQYSNLIYLIGGAWLPWAVCAGLRLIRDNDSLFSLATLRKSSLLSIFLALMILGGDLQTPYLAGVMLVWFALYFRHQNGSQENNNSDRLTTSSKQTSKTENDSKLEIKTELPMKETNPLSDLTPVTNSNKQLKTKQNFSSFLFVIFRARCCQNIIRLALAGFLLLLLTAIVLLPGRKYSGQTERAILTAPISVWQIPRFLKNKDSKDHLSSDKELQCNDLISGQESGRYMPRALESKGTLQTIREGIFCQNMRYPGHHQDIYHYSQSPRMLPGLIWPNITGHIFNNSNWIGSYSNEDLWTPSCYLGIIPAIFALSIFSLGFRRRKIRALDKKGSELSDGSVSRRSQTRISKSTLASTRKSSQNRGESPPRSTRGSDLKTSEYHLKNLSNTPYKFSSESDNKNIELSEISKEGHESLSSLLIEKDLIIWLSRFSIMALLAALGGFGLFWFLRAFGVFFGNGQDLAFKEGDPVGGIYWLMTVFLPGFATFRFPAKMMMFFLFGISFLSAFGFDRQVNNTRLKKTGGIIALLSLLILIIVPFCDVRHLAGLSPDENLPADLNPPAVKIMIYGAACQVLLFLGALFSLRYFAAKNPNHKPFFVFLILFLATLDLLYSNLDFVPTRSKIDLTQKSNIAEMIHKDHSENVSPYPPRVYYKKNWIPDRIAAFNVNPVIREELKTEWQQRALIPKFIFLENLGALQHIASTSASAGMIQIFTSLDIMNSGDKTYQPYIKGILNALDMEYSLDKSHDTVLPEMTTLYGFEKSKEMSKDDWKSYFNHLVEEGWPLDTVLRKNPEHVGRIHIIRSDQLSQSTNPLERLLEDLQIKDEILPGESAKIIRYENERIEMAIDLKQPGKIILCEQYHPEWRAEALAMNTEENPIGSDSSSRSASSKTIPLKIVKTRELMRQFELPAGSWRVEMTFSPTSFYWGVGISFVAWILIAVVGIIGGRHSLGSVKWRYKEGKEGISSP